MSALNKIQSILGLLGKPLDCNIYVGGKPLALAGSLVSPALLEHLQRLDPHDLAFTLANGERSEMGLVSQPEDVIRAEPTTLLEQAGLASLVPSGVYATAVDQMHIVFDTCRYLDRLDIGAVASVANELLPAVRSCTQNLCNYPATRDVGGYTYQHGVNLCCLVFSLFADFAESEAQLLDLGVGLLLHDIGKTRIDDRILAKTGLLTGAEEKIMARHVLYGYNLVRNQAGVAPEAKDIILNHHERCDGSGYLRGLREAELSQWDLITAVADVFDALTSPRSHQPPLDAHRAIGMLVHGSGAQYSSRIVHYLLRGMGRFPVGTFVALSNGEIGVVSRVNQVSLALPEVCVLFGADGRRLRRPQQADLAHTHDGLYIDHPIDLYPLGEARSA